AFLPRPRRGGSERALAGVERHQCRTARALIRQNCPRLTMVMPTLAASSYTRYFMATTTPERVTSRKPDLSVNFCGIAFKNPVIAASGTFGYGIEFEDVVALGKLGGFVSKGLSREPMVGNPPPRLFETAAGMLNSIGLQNIGARAFIEEK